MNAVGNPSKLIVSSIFVDAADACLFYILKDKKALKSQIERWAALPGLTRLVPCHGDVVSRSAPEALRAAAATL
jgi:hypothetical protein